MNRRTALFSTLLLGGFLPLRLRAQDDRVRGGFRPTIDDEPRFEEPGAGGRFTPPPEINQRGHKWGIYPIDTYTSLPHSPDTTRPEQSIVDWVLRYTGSNTWHGQDITVLSANRDELRVFHNPEMLSKVAKVVERFVDAYFDVLTMRVRIVAAVDPRWRYSIFSQLDPKELGPHGQQAWTTDLSTAEMILAQMGINQSATKLLEERRVIVNGQTLYIKTSAEKTFVSGLDRASAAELGFEPRVAKLDEGVELRLSPLLNFDGNAIDLAIDLKATTVRKLHTTRVVAPRRIGPAEMQVEVPEVSETRFNQTIGEWPLDKVLILSAGIHPGILQSKNGLFNMRIPGTVPTATELLVFLDVSTRLDSTSRERTRR